MSIPKVTPAKEDEYMIEDPVRNKYKVDDKYKPAPFDLATLDRDIDEDNYDPASDPNNAAYYDGVAKEQRMEKLREMRRQEEARQ